MSMTQEQRKQLFDMRRAMDALVGKIAENTEEVNAYTAAVREWKEGAYVVGDVRMYQGAPYKCVQAHDSTGNPLWSPEHAPALWMQYHGTSRETARAWVSPSGAHDMYKAGEWMLWTDGAAYECLMDTAYSPTEYAQAWKKGE